MIIVTGGAGFIGSVILWQLNELGFSDLIVVDDMNTDDRWKNIAKRSLLSICRRDEFLSQLPKLANDGIDAIIHMGACSSTTERNMDFLIQNNLNYSQEIFSFCTDWSIPFLYASSAATYGSGEYGFSDEGTPKLLPINGYGYSKYLFDCWVEKQKRCPPFWAGFKFFNVYGPNEYHKGPQASVVHHAYPQIAQNGILKLFKSYRPDFEDGGQKRDFIYVKDVADIVCHFYLNRSSIESGIYNVGTGKSRTFADLGKAVFSAMNQSPSFNWIDMPANIKDQYQYFTEADVRKLREKGKYQKEMTSLEDGVRDYIQGYLSKPDPFL